MKERRVWVVLSARAMDWEVSGVYDTAEKLLDTIKEDWGLDDLTIDDMLDSEFQDGYEIRIHESTYHVSKTEIRDEKINTIIS